MLEYLDLLEYLLECILEHLSMFEYTSGYLGIHEYG